MFPSFKLGYLENLALIIIGVSFLVANRHNVKRRFVDHACLGRNVGLSR